MPHRPLTVGRTALLEDGSDAHFREFLHAFMVFARCLEGVRDCLARQIGVTAPQYEILSHLREASGDDGLTVTEIADRLHCSAPFATTEVGKLERLGMISKRRDPLDARRVRVAITASCEDRFRSIAPLQRQLNDALFKSLGGRDFRMLHKLFRTLSFDGDSAIALAATIRAPKERLAV